MSTMSIALLAFVAGFLTCAAVVGAIVLWSFSDRRVTAVAPEPAKQKAAA